MCNNHNDDTQLEQIACRVHKISQHELNDEINIDSC